VEQLLLEYEAQLQEEEEDADAEGYYTNEYPCGERMWRESASGEEYGSEDAMTTEHESDLEADYWDPQVGAEESEDCSGSERSADPEPAMQTHEWVQ
jgi:hypothetical protein